jgi:uncharacterized membrane protein
MLRLVLGLVLFLGGHSVSVFAPHWRDQVVLRLGTGRWRLWYSLVSLLGFYLLVVGFGMARAHPVVVYVPRAWMRTIADLLMVPVFPLLFAAYFPGKIRSVLKHPMLVAIKCWSLAHLIANGMLADVLLFGSFLVWAVVVRISLTRRVQRPVPSLPSSAANDLFAVLLGLLLYAFVVLWVHQKLFGVSPIV